MAEDDDVLLRLHRVGEALGRPPEPVAEADPWEEPDPLDASPAVPVVFPGNPRLRVTLHDDGEDTVELATNVFFDIPRRDTVDVVTAILSGRQVYVRERTGLRSVFSRLALVDELVVEVPGATYTQHVPWAPGPFNGWMAALPRRS